MKQFAEMIERFCQTYRECCVVVERREEERRVRQELERLWGEVSGKLDIAEPRVLLALLDAYEVTRDEEMLQELLNVISAGVDQLEVSVDSVKLLAYCYYYVEEEECAEKARKMLEELKRKGEDVTESEKIVTELTENF